MNVKRALSRFRAPDEQETEDRSWEIVRAAYQQREPAGRERSLRRPFALTATSILIVGAGALTPAGATVGRLVDHAFEKSHRSRPVLTASAPPAQAFVTDETQNRLLVVDLPSGRIARSVPVPADPEDIAATDSGVIIVVSSHAGKVTVLNGDTLKVMKTFSGFDEPHIAAISPDDQYAYITDDARGTVTVIRLSDMKVTDTVAVGIGAHHLAFSPTERTVWVALGESAQEITTLSTVTSRPQPPATPVGDPGRPHVIGHFAPGFPAHDLAFSPNGQTIWVTSAAGPDVTAFDARTHRVLFRIPVGAPPQHIVFAGGYAYLTSGYGSTIEKVNAATGHVVTRTSAPYGSFELDAGDGYVVSSSLLGGTLAIYTPNLKLLRVVKLAPTAREVAISRP